MNPSNHGQCHRRRGSRDDREEKEKEGEGTETGSSSSRDRNVPPPALTQQNPASPTGEQGGGGGESKGASVPSPSPFLPSPSVPSPPPPPPPSTASPSTPVQQADELERMAQVYSQPPPEIKVSGAESNGGTRYGSVSSTLGSLGAGTEYNPLNDSSNSNTARGVFAHTITADRIRRRLKFFFMNPMEKWHARRSFPGSCCCKCSRLCSDSTVVPVCPSRYNHVNYLWDTKISFSHLFIKGWDTTREIQVYPPADGPLAVYKKASFFEYLDYAVTTYAHIRETAIGTYTYEHKNGTVVPPVLCVSHYKKALPLRHRLHQTMVRPRPLPSPALPLRTVSTRPWCDHDHSPRQHFPAAPSPPDHGATTTTPLATSPAAPSPPDHGATTTPLASTSPAPPDHGAPSPALPCGTVSTRPWCDHDHSPRQHFPCGTVSTRPCATTTTPLASTSPAAPSPPDHGATTTTPLASTSPAAPSPPDHGATTTTPLASTSPAHRLHQTMVRPRPLPSPALPLRHRLHQTMVRPRPLPSPALPLRHRLHQTMVRPPSPALPLRHRLHQTVRPRPLPSPALPLRHRLHQTMVRPRPLPSPALPLAPSPPDHGATRPLPSPHFPCGTVSTRPWCDHDHSLASTSPAHRLPPDHGATTTTPLASTSPAAPSPPDHVPSPAHRLWCSFASIFLTAPSPPDGGAATATPFISIFLTAPSPPDGGAATATPFASIFLTAPSPPEGDAAATAPSAKASAPPSSPRSLSPEEAIMQQEQELSALGCRPVPIKMDVRKELSPKDTLLDKPFYPRYVTVHQCDDSRSFCQEEGCRCMRAGNSTLRKEITVKYAEGGKTAFEKRELPSDSHCECDCAADLAGKAQG
ncbi:putative mucolipin-3 [Penaeus vannamei]|uniref:Putative mucolipin-3 n=1 Tax=Penaeus vannamei TaxID=6689 RepID=A0A423TB07_PENVA|nr:putative mucolipin-3 [Penaeus vannamei]